MAMEEADLTARSDIWLDHTTMRYLSDGFFPADLTSRGKRRIRKRARPYRWDAESNKLLRIMEDGTVKQVPPIGERLDLVRVAHDNAGHFGIRRTEDILRL